MLAAHQAMSTARHELAGLTRTMDLFGLVVVAVAVVAAGIAVVTYLRAGSLYRQVGRMGELSLATGDDEGAATRELIHEEVQQMLDAIDAKRAARGKSALDAGSEGTAVSSRRP